MIKFNFSLENALKYRQSIEEQEIGLLAKSMQKVQLEESHSTRLNLEKQNHLRSYDFNKISLSTMQQQAAYIAGLDFRIKNQLEKLEQAQQAFSRQRSRVIKASTKRKTLEELKGKHLAEYQAVISQAEQKVLDGVGIAAYAHRIANY